MKLGERVGRAIDTWVTTILLGALPLVGSTVIGVIYSQPDPPSGKSLIVVAVAALAGLYGAIHASFRGVRIDKRDRALRGHSQSLSKYFGVHSPASIALLQRIEREVFEGVEGTLRLSLFAPKSKSEFRLVARHSTDQTFNEPGERPIYPASEGLVAKVWNEQKSAHWFDLPQQPAKWRSQMVSKFKISETGAAQLRMQSRSYAGIILPTFVDGVQRSVGVLVAESTDPNGVGGEHYDELKKLHLIQHLAQRCVETRAVADLLADIS